MVNIRKAIPNDINILSELVRRSYHTVAERFDLTKENCPKHPSNCTDQWIRSEVERGVEYFIIEDEEGEAGTAALEKAEKDLCYLERLAVLPHKRNRGYGEKLVDHLFRYARSRGFQRISIGIIAKQDDLKMWYAKIGFREGITRRFEHLPFDVLFMECDLNEKRF